MKENQHRQKWIVGPEMPHEKEMDEKGLEFVDLDESIQQEIRDFDVAYCMALNDCDITEEEFNVLISMSYEIVKKIQVVYKDYPRT